MPQIKVLITVLTGAYGVPVEPRRDPVEGDWVEVHEGQTITRKMYFDPVEFVEPEPDAIRVITPRSFFARFTPPERTAMRKSVDDIVIDIREELQIAREVDLDNPNVFQSLTYLTYLEILTEDRVDAMLVDGNTNEQ